MQLQQQVAIIGLGCRFPGNANNPSSFFENLSSKKDCIVSTPQDRWNLDFYQDDDKNRAGKLIPRKGGYMDFVNEFDNEAFNMNAKEAANIDPQQRILLEVTHQALEDANFDYKGSNTGVFIGAGASDFTQLATFNSYHVNEYTATGGSMAIPANRISFNFDLRGPSMTIDSACSAAGSALHVAMRCLLSGDCEQAVIGGINVLSNHSMTIAFSKLGVLAPDCKCKSFDAAANGYVRSEGCGVIVLKRLDRALADKNHIYCVIDTVKCNEDGAQSPSLTMPSADAQQELIKKTLLAAQIAPENIFYVEAHGTGTPVGDPIEANAIGKLLCGTTRANKLKIGSVKTNIGHLEFASCIASLIKCALMFDKSQLLPSIHYTTPNPKIKFDEYKMQVQTENEAFVATQNQYMMVSSFGFGGANCCILLQSAPNKQQQQVEATIAAPYVYLTSALTKSALQDKIQQFQALNVQSAQEQAQLMLSLNSKCTSNDKYASYGVGDAIQTSKFVDPIKLPATKQPIVFVFSGQGPQHVQMGKQLYARFAKFRQVIDECDALYKQYSGKSVIEDFGLFGTSTKDASAIPSVNTIQVTLPGLIFMQIGLFELWKHFGVTPDAIMGHSFGEMCAIYASETLSLKDIICITIARTALMAKLPQNEGTMLAVGCGEEQAEKMIQDLKLTDSLWIAAVNSPQAVTLGGRIPSVALFSAECKKQNLFHRQLNVTNAFHTPLMSSLREEAHKTFAEISQQTPVPKIPIISTVTGELWNKAFDYTYFWQNVENRVVFSKAIDTAMETFGKDCIFLEMAPHPVLSMSMRQCNVTNLVYSQHREEQQQSTILIAAAKLACMGYKIQWEKVVQAKEVNNSQLVPYNMYYPYQRKTFVNEDEWHKLVRCPVQFGEMIGIKLIHHETTYQNYISTKSYDWLYDHQVQQSIIFPAAAYIEIMLESLTESAGQSGIYSLQNVQIKNPLLVPDDSTFTLVQTVVAANKQVSIFSKREGQSSWTEHAQGLPAANTNIVGTPISDEALLFIQSSCKFSILPREECYKRFSVMNLDYGPAFQCITTLYQGDEESLGVLSIDHLNSVGKYIVHPAILDCCFQTFLGTIQASAYMYLPTQLKNIHVFGKITGTIHVHCVLTTLTDKDMTGDIHVYQGGVLKIKIEQFTCTKVVSNNIGATNSYYTTVWQSKAFPTQDWTCDVSQHFAQDLSQWKQVVSQHAIYAEAMAYYVQSAAITESVVSALPLHAKRHVAWLQSLSQKYPNARASAIEEMQKMENFDKECKAILRVGQSLLQLITNKENDVSRIMFGDDLVASLYQSSITFRPSIDMFAHLLSQLQVDPERVIRILEVGSGTGTLAKKILPFLSKFANRVEYYFTDVSASFFLSDKRLKEYSFVQYKVIDIEKPLQAQGVDDCSLDMVIGFDVVHTARNLQQTMLNLNKALVPNGMLFLIEPTRMEPYMHFIFGVFREWWAFEDDRTKCCITDEEWKELFPKCGFANFTSYFLSSDHVHSIVRAQKVESFEKSAANVQIYKQANVIPLLHLVQDRLKQQQENKQPSPLIIVTKGAQMESARPELAPLVGFARVIANENSSWIVKSIDLDPQATEQEDAQWIEKLTANLNQFENEIAVRKGQVFVPRLIKREVSTEHAPVVATPKHYRLEISDGILDNLKYHETAVPTLKQGQVLVRNIASALNFKDVMLAMNMLDIEKKHLGLEFAGIVEQVAANSKFKIGDAVYGIGENCFASYIVANEDLVVLKPQSLTFEEAASIPIVFLTTYYALIYKANIQEDQVLLIHSGAGGVGQAAIQIANYKKAKVVATVGSEQKQNLLRTKYQVEQFANSHANWYEQVKKLHPEGVDLVLNSLSGNNIAMGINALRAGGNFIEIGKRDILNNYAMHLQPFVNNLSYFSVHLDMLIDTHSKVLGKMLVEIGKLFDAKVFSPFVDKVYSCTKTNEAFKYMQSGKHMGKIILSYNSCSNCTAESATPVPNPQIPVYPKLQLFANNKTFVLSGGLGALGFEIAQWMVKQGARYLVLLSRNTSNLKKEHKRGLQLMQKQGANVHIAPVNVTDRKAMEKMYNETLAELKYPAVGGLIHLAMVLDDDSIAKQNEERFSKVMAPKIDGALNMIEPLVSKQTLDFVVLFSSISSVIGNPEQSNYASSNAYLDSLAKKCNFKVINLGAVDDVGICATDYKLRKIMAARGLENAITVAQVLDYVKLMVSNTDTQQFVTPLNVKSLCDFNPLLKQRMSHLIQHKQTEEQETNAGGQAGIAKMIEKLLQLDKDIDVNEKLTTYGVDSLLAVEISSMLGKSFNIKVSQMDILSGITVAQLQAKMQ